MRSRRNCAEFGVPIYATGSGREGIVHVIGPELGLTQPGLTIVCGDSHTSTHGAFGALAFGIGTSEVEHVLATQTLPQSKPRSLRIRFVGEPAAGVTAKDYVLAAIGELGVDGGVGHVIEYAGPAIEALSMEGRLTICNMSIEAGARAGLIAPDDTTFEYLRGRPGAPADFDAAVERWRTLPTDDDAAFDRELEIDVSRIRPQVTWGTNPGMVVSIDGVVPDPADARRRRRPRGSRARARLHGARARHADPGHHGRARVHRLVHELAHRRPARRRGCRAGPPGASVGARDGRAGVGAGEASGRGGRTRPRLRRRRLRVAPRRLLDVPRHEPRRALTGRALRVDVEPQLRGPAGRGRAHAPRQPGGGCGDGDHAATSRRRATSWRCRHEIVPHGHLARRRARPRRRRHRPDHPEAVPEAHRAHRLRRVPLLRLDEGPGVRAAPSSRERSCSPGGTSAAARPASTRRGRSRTTASKP